MADAKEPRTKRRWRQSSLRSPFVLTTLVAILGSWYAYEMQQAARRRAAIAEIEDLGGAVDYPETDDNLFPLAESPKWYSVLRRVHGDRRLGNAAAVWLRGESVSDADLARLRNLTSLEYLCLRYAKITDAGLKSGCPIP